MRFAVPILLASTALAALSPSKILSSRQAVVKRDLLDVCAALDLDLQVDDPLNGKPLVLGHLDLCLCVSVLPTFIETNIIAKAAVLLIGETKLLAQLEALIEGQSSKQHCKYPPHAAPTCLKDFLCTFNCTDGFVPTPPAAPTTCSCPPPKSVCNGKCGDFPHGCGSQAPDAPSRMKRAERCAADETVCGTGVGGGWECVKTVSDLFSCGGCTVPSPFTLNTVPTGVDCSAIPNVGAVSCLASKCLVTSCKAGFAVSPDGDACVTSTTPALKVQPVSAKRASSILPHAKKSKPPLPAVVAGVKEASEVVVPEVAAVADAVDTGVKIERDLPVVGAVLGEGVGAAVEVERDVPVIGAGAGVKIGREVPIVGAVVDEALSAVVPEVAKVAEGAGVGVGVL